MSNGQQIYKLTFFTEVFLSTNIKKNYISEIIIGKGEKEMDIAARDGCCNYLNDSETLPHFQ